ncbi:MAG: hypothetical protein AB4042_04125 [Leptolyngbyaceae cyanobacterium]
MFMKTDFSSFPSPQYSRILIFFWCGLLVLGTACTRDGLNNEISNHSLVLESVENGQVEMIIHGEVISVGRLNIDKSGRNPKYQVSVALKPSKIEGGNIDLQRDLLVFKAPESQILEQIERLPNTGEEIGVESRVSSDSPRTFPIIKIWFQ